MKLVYTYHLEVTMKRTIKDFDLKNKKVIIRCDFNVPIQDGLIIDDSRIVESIPTISYAVSNGARVILMSHLGRVKDEKDRDLLSLRPVANRLSELLGINVVFITETRGNKLEDSINNLKNGDVLLLENTRFEDLNGNLESTNSDELARYWSSLGDIFINDAFGTCHRSHASNVGIASYLPNGIGFLMEKELHYLTGIIDNPKRPFTVILGGAKVNDKIDVINNLAAIADYVLIGGGMAYTFFKAAGIPIGKSILDESSVDLCLNLMNEYSDKIILPIDGVYCNGESNRECFLSDVKPDEKGFDIGKGTVKLFKQYIDMSETIFWNGPLGMFEDDEYAYGTRSILEYLASSDKITVIGGGDTGSAVSLFGYKDKFSHVSTGGGASLELLSGKILPGVGVIDEK